MDVVQQGANSLQINKNEGAVWSNGHAALEIYLEGLSQKFKWRLHSGLSFCILNLP